MRGGYAHHHRFKNTQRTPIGIVTVLGMRISRGRQFANNAFKAIALGLAVFICTPPAHANPKYAGIVVDAKTGKTLYADKADSYRYPASLTKIMTLYVVFEELEAGRLTLNSRLKVSKYAAGRPPSKIGVKAGKTIKVKDAILALVTKSANDVATVVAENISGSEKKFAERMTRTARQIGMKKTTFRNPHGLPNSGQRTTARDMALLGRAIQERFPEHYKFFNTRLYTYKGRRYGNHNKLLGRVKGVDGIKTGYIRASGFNLVTSVNTGGRHIVAVVMGGRTGARRNAHMTNLIRRYLPKASRGARTAPLLVSKPQVQRFVAADLKNAPIPRGKPGATSAQPATAPIVLAQAAVSAPQTVAVSKPVPAPASTGIPGFGGRVPVPPKAVKSRFDNTFAVATALPPIPPESPGAPLTTQSISRTALIEAARARAGAGLPVRTDQPAPTQPLPVRTVQTQVIEVIPADQVIDSKQVVASANAAAAPLPLQQAQGDVDEERDSTVTVATSDRPDIEPGWQVQIGATETENQAVALLKKAKSRSGPALRGRDPYTEPVDANGQTLYRARFIGFETKTAARRACRTLKKAKFACFAIYQ